MCLVSINVNDILMKDTQAEPSVSVYHSLFADDVDIKIRDLNAVCIGVGVFFSCLVVYSK